uniref:ATP synthase complex subunit 8 n=1 Tax=Leptestheria brevirostris TaxID=2653809 RepID=A0A7M1ICP6_9CRUS|nr:ATP synthase F0 subunit 8 [Leptestheria brevirostris]QOQ37308.1 ATP synthase F0 subunit 8 [Leptestheria brevirostris]
MPQMAPLSWLGLFLFFTFVFVLFLTASYSATSSCQSPLPGTANKILSMSWEW